MRTESVSCNSSTLPRTHPSQVSDRTTWHLCGINHHPHHHCHPPWIGTCSSLPGLLKINKLTQIVCIRRVRSYRNMGLKASPPLSQIPFLGTQSCKDVKAVDLRITEEGPKHILSLRACGSFAPEHHPLPLCRCNRSEKFVQGGPGRERCLLQRAGSAGRETGLLVTQEACTHWLCHYWETCVIITQPGRDLGLTPTNKTPQLLVKPARSLSRGNNASE